MIGITILPGCFAERTKTKVLAVDDDPQVLRVLLRVLDPALYQVETAMTHAEAVRMADELSPAFILLDLHLSYPQPDGLLCLKALRKAGYTQPIFILSADASFEQVHQAARAGANGYLVKCDPNRFLERLTKLIKGSMEASCSSHSLPPSATAYLETRGFSHLDISLLEGLSISFCQEQEIAHILNRSDSDIQKQFQSIRERLGAKNQVDLARILGVLSCFQPIDDRI